MRFIGLLLLSAVACSPEPEFPESQATTSSTPHAKSAPVRAQRDDNDNEMRQIKAEHAQRQADETQRRQAEQDDRDRRAEERKDAQDHVRDAAQQSTTKHENECRRTYAARLKTMQDGIAEMPKLRQQARVRCADIGQHCATISNGTSVCRGITQEQQQVFDSLCAQLSTYRVEPDEDQDCADVDPVELGYDFSFTDAQISNFRKLKASSAGAPP